MNTPALSVGLPGEIRERLEQVAAFKVQEALARHLDEIMEEQRGSGTKIRLEELRAMKGAGARKHGPRSEEDIAAQIHEFRGDE